MACFFSLCINWISRRYVAVKKTTWPFMRFIYLVTKKIIVDNAAAGGMRETPAEWRRWAASYGSRTAIRFFTLGTPVWARRIIQLGASQVETRNEVAYAKRHYQN
jgi:hypothetical protein